VRPQAISNSACIIILERIGRLDLLRALYQRLVIPDEVHAECGIAAEWLEIRQLARQDIFDSLCLRLGRGEAAAIALATELAPVDLILDDLKARRIAAQLNLHVIGTVGLLLRAKQSRHITLIAPVLEDMMCAGFHLGEELHAAALHMAGE